MTGDNIEWVEKYLESRIKRGEQWKDQLSDHKRLAKASQYVRILGDGFRAVSISDENPCGRLLDKDGNEIKKDVDLKVVIKNAKSVKKYKPRGNKPEHRLQAFLIRAALQNEQEFGRFHHLLPMLKNTFDEIIFVTDELAIKPGKGQEERRADIIALGSKDGEFFPVFVELKNDRLLTELKDQLNGASKLIWEDERARAPFRRFLSAVSGVEIDRIRHDAGAARKMLIWPKSASGEEVRRVSEARQEGFLIVDFEPTYFFS